MKRLYRSKDNKVVAGVLGGIGEYLDVDPVILRIAWIVVTVFSGIFPGVVIYLLAILVVPKALESDRKEVENEAE